MADGSNLGFRDHFRTLIVQYEIGGSCDQAVGFRVQQSVKSVELTSVVHEDSGDCSQINAMGVGLIHLDAPMHEGRLLLHAPVTPNR